MNSLGAVTAARLEPINPSVITLISEKARKLKADGHEIYNLSVGEPDFATDAHVRDAAIEAMRRGETTYPRTQGSYPLIGAIASRFDTDYGVTVDGAQILVSNGAKQILFNAFMATLNDGDEVIIPIPFWTSYPDILALAGGVPVMTAAMSDGSLLPDVEAIEAAITPRTKWILLNTPSNPSGVVFPNKIMTAILDVLRRHEHVMLMCDEIYDKIVFDNRPFQSALALAPDLADRILIVNGVSKTYSMTGWRIGYGIGSKRLISAMTLVQGQSTSGACSIAQAAGAAAISAPQDAVEHRRHIYQERRDLVKTGLVRDCGLRMTDPSGAFYAMPEITEVLGKTHPKFGKIEDDTSFCHAALETNGVAIVPGSAFGAPGYVRLSFATSNEVISNGISRLATFISVCN